MDEWRRFRLEEITENYDGLRKPIKESDRSRGPYPYYGASGVIDYVDGFLFDGDYLLVAEDGENLRTRKTPIAFLARGRFWVNNHAHVVRGGCNSDTRFLLYVLNGSDISGYLTGAVMPKLTQSNLNKIELNIPPLNEQRAISHVLGVLDDKIELNRKQNETLEAMARAMFKAWFVDFEPVRAKMEGRWKRGQSLPGMPANLYDLFPDRMVESDLGEIPEGWHVLSFEDVASQRKEVVKPEDFPNDMFFHYSIPAFDAGRMPVCELGESIRSNKSVVRDGFVLISKLNPHIPRVWNIGEAGASAVCSTEFTVWEAKEPANGAFLYCLASLDVFNEALCQLVTGTSNSHQRVKPEQFKGIRVFSAVEDLISGFSMAAAAILESTYKRRIESADLSRIRDVLLPKLVSGELRISEAERFLDKRGVWL